MRITLAEFKAFCDQLSDDWYFEGDECFIDDDFWEGKFNPSEIINVRTDEITLCYQGREDKPESEKYVDFLPLFRKWKTGIAYEIVTVEIPKGKKADLIAIVKEKFGGKNARVL